MHGAGTMPTLVAVMDQCMPIAGCLLPAATPAAPLGGWEVLPKGMPSPSGHGLSGYMVSMVIWFQGHLSGSLTGVIPEGLQRCFDLTGAITEGLQRCSDLTGAITEGPQRCPGLTGAISEGPQRCPGLTGAISEGPQNCSGLTGNP